MAGLEVEDNQPVAPPFSGVVVAQLRSVTRHPNADKLTVCDVDVGTARLSIVCGAPNVAPGMKVPCAVVGAVLPGELRIKAATMRGVESQGMLCSARELGLSEDHGGLLVLDASTQLGADVREVLALEDRRLSIKLTPNRADCLSVLGVAREVAALTGAILTPPAMAAVSPSLTDRLPVRVEARDLCGRFSGRVIRGVDAAAATPGWMRQRLERSGQRPISALVDISNYVMLELGRPSHIFDLDKVQGGLQVRWGRAGEELVLLNGQRAVVDESVGVIADDAGVEALAGIMGGEATAVTLATRNVYVEAAFWWPDAIRGRSRRYNFTTDAAHRFERGVDFATTVDHIEYISRLILEICGGAAGPIDDTVLDLPPRPPVTMRVERCRRVIGVPITAEAMANAFERLGFQFVQSADAITVTPPTYRFDLGVEEDLIEEVARLVGYSNIPAHPPVAAAAMKRPTEERLSPHDVRRALAALGYQEVMTYSFVDANWEREQARNPNPIAVLNPIASQMAVMRSSLICGLAQTLSYNLNRQATRVRIFELGRVFSRAPEVAEGLLEVGGISQPQVVGGLAYGPSDEEQWGQASRGVDFFDLKGDLEQLARGMSFVPAEHPLLHPGRSARIQIEGRATGFVGELHPRIQQFHGWNKPAVVFEIELETLLRRALPQPRDVAKIQAVERDIAVIVNESVPFEAILKAIDGRRRTDGRLAALREVRLFDVYRPGNAPETAPRVNANALLIKEKSLAFRIVLQDTERPLADSDADAAVAAIVAELEQSCGARLRH
jgi:phenylalanyl-tRNA synthetase beta chain